MQVLLDDGPHLGCYIADGYVYVSPYEDGPRYFCSDHVPQVLHASAKVTHFSVHISGEFMVPEGVADHPLSVWCVRCILPLYLFDTDCRCAGFKAARWSFAYGDPGADGDLSDDSGVGEPEVGDQA